MLDKGFFVAAGTCLWEYGQYDFQDTKEDLVEGASSKVDYVALVDGESKVLCEVKSPSVMKKVGELLPAQGFELKWVRGQPLVPKILAKVITLFSIGRNINFNKICVVRIVSGSETDGMAISFLPQLLDCMPSCER